jgi:hypothetical protein
MANLYLYDFHNYFIFARDGPDEMRNIAVGQPACTASTGDAERQFMSQTHSIQALPLRRFDGPLP